MSQKRRQEDTEWRKTRLPACYTMSIISPKRIPYGHSEHSDTT